MIITGKIIDNTEDEILISANFPAYLLEKRQIEEVEITVTDGRQISAVQRRHIYATFADIANYTGHVTEELKDIFKALYIAKTGCKWFSLSDVDMTTASDFLQFIIDFCLEHGIPTKDSYLDRSPDISRFLYMSLANRSCALCGKPAEVHHSGESRVGMGRNRNKIHHLGLEAVALCRTHHNAIHNGGEQEFFDRHHIWPIHLDEYLCKKLNLKV